MSAVIDSIFLQPSQVRSDWMTNPEAAQRVVRFWRRFGPRHLWLACHAALPLLLTPEVVNLMRINFLAAENVPWEAEVDLLLSDLCRPLGGDMFMVEPPVREVLLAQLEKLYGQLRPLALAQFLQDYLPRLSENAAQWEQRRVYTWISYAYINPDRAVFEIQKYLERSTSLDTPASEARASQFQITVLVEAADRQLKHARAAGAYQALSNSTRLLAALHNDADGKLKAELSEAARDPNQAISQATSPGVARWLSATATPETETNHQPGFQTALENIDRLVFSPGFQRFLFANRFERGEYGSVAITPLFPGLAGGMVFAALDYYYAKKPVPHFTDSTQLPDNLINYLNSRQAEILTGDIELKLLQWMRLQDADIIKRTRQSEIPELRKLTSADRPTPVVLVRARSLSDTTENHIVLVQGFADVLQQPLMTVIRVYDPNYPDKVVSIYTPGEPFSQESLSQSTGEPLRGFFILPYKPRVPPDIKEESSTAVNRLTPDALRARLAYDGGLRDLDLTGMDLSAQDFNGVDFSASNLSNALLSKANFQRAIFTRAKLVSAALEYADLSGADLQNADFSKASLVGANLSGARVTGAVFTDADLRESILGEAYSPDFVPILCAQAHSYAVHQGNDRAAAIYQQATRLDPQNTQVHRLLAETLQTLGQVDAAEKEFQAALSLSSGQPEFAFDLGQFYFQQGRLTEADSYLSQAASPNTSSTWNRAPALNALAQVYLQTGRVDEAMPLLDSANNLDPDYGAAYLTRINAYLQQRRYNDAEEALNTAQTQMLRPLPEGYLTIGRAYLGRHMLPEAEKAFNQVLQSQPGDLAASAGLVEVALADPSYTSAGRYLSPLLASIQARGNLDEGRKILRDLLEQASTPTNRDEQIEFLKGLADAFERLEDPEDAKATLILIDRLARNTSSSEAE